MKAKYLFILLLVFSLAFAGCSGDSSDTASDDTATSTQDESGETSSDTEETIAPADYDDALSFLDASIADTEENTSSMVDAIAAAAKKEANYSATKLTDEALEYISSNYSDYFSDNSVMEYAMFYGYYLEYAYADNGSDNTYANLGMDVYQAIKYVYRGTADVEDDDVQANLEQVADALTELGYMD